jgi:hypothetical protein
MFSEVPGGTVKRALSSTTTTTATGAAIGLSPTKTGVGSAGSLTTTMGAITPCVDHPAEPSQLYRRLCRVLLNLLTLRTP